MICISHCHIMVLSMLMLWLPKNTFPNLFFVFEHFFHFYACAFKRLTCIICTFILHINCELISSVSFSFVCIQFANIILLWPKLHDNWISWCDNYISFSKKPFIMLRLVNTFVLLILGHFMCHCCIYLLHMHFVSWFMMFSMTSMYLSTFLYLSYKCKFVS